VATDRPRQRKAAAPPARKTLKTTIVVDVDLSARWAAAAALQGMDRSAFAVAALREALKGVVVFIREKSADEGHPSGPEDRATAA
jgi:hypothetical protein